MFFSVVLKCCHQTSAARYPTYTTFGGRQKLDRNLPVDDRQFERRGWVGHRRYPAAEKSVKIGRRLLQSSLSGMEALPKRMAHGGSLGASTQKSWTTAASNPKVQPSCQRKERRALQAEATTRAHRQPLLSQSASPRTRGETHGLQTSILSPDRRLHYKRRACRKSIDMNQVSTESINYFRYSLTIIVHLRGPQPSALAVPARCTADPSPQAWIIDTDDIRGM